MAALNVWMNGRQVGEWTALRSGTPVFVYTDAWVDSPYSRALSLSLPITANREVRGPAVDYYFENLLPDSVEIRRRLRTKFGARSLSAFDLLAEIGRDCVGAIQLLPPEITPEGWNRIDATRLSTSQVERLLRAMTQPALGRNDADDFRISIAGAQEKTALLSMGGKWFRPNGATPTTHILKLPLGLIGGFRADFSDSVENEWFCAQFLRELGLPVAETSIATFGTQKVLVTSRFDRRWMGVDAELVTKRNYTPGKKHWIARLPQEDFCQATGIPPERKYEADGGPSIETGLTLLTGSDEPATDKTTFVLAQLAFWLLAATDGHGKNFSLHHSSGGHYRMTPLYDVLSAWPIVGSGGSQIAQQKLRLAMSLRGRRRHYKLDEIDVRHWRSLAQRAVVPDLWDRMITLVEAAGSALERVTNALPKDFPKRLPATIGDGVRAQVKRFKIAPS